MKNLYYVGLLSILILSCEDVVEVEVPTGEPKLVINAALNYYPDEVEVPFDDSGDEIYLSLTGPFFDTIIENVVDADVFITNLGTNERITYRHLELTPGTYRPFSSFIPEFDADYRLTVRYKDEIYNATTSLKRSVPIDTIVQGDKSLFDGDETEVIITITDDPEVENYYLFDLDMNLFLPTEDRFFQGQNFPFSYFYEDVDENQDLIIQLLGIDRDYYNYITLLLEQSGQNSGGPFQAPPALIRGNIINTTNQDNVALGYFSISETYTRDFILKAQE